MALESGLQEVGYTNDSQVWMNLLLDVDIKQVSAAIEKLKDTDAKSFKIKATVLMGSERAEQLIEDLQIAIENSREWHKTGVNPQRGQNNAG